MPTAIPSPMPQFSSQISPQHSLLRMVGNSELKAIDEKKASESRQNSSEIQGLSLFLQKRWEAAKRARINIDERLLQCFRAREGIYDPKDLAEIATYGGSKIFMLLTNVKCRTIESWIKDVMLPAGEKPWSVSPTPIPDIPSGTEQSIATQVAQEIGEVVQQFGPNVITVEMVEARLKEVRSDMKKMFSAQAQEAILVAEEKISDVFEEGNLYGELARFLKDFATYPAAFIKGPIKKKRKVLEWKAGKAEAVDKIVKAFECVSGFDMYPGPTTRSLQEGYFFERIRLTHAQLASMKGVPGYDDKTIDNILENPPSHLKEWLFTDQERARLEGRPLEMIEGDDVIDAIMFWGDIPPKDLISWGMDPAMFSDMFSPLPATAILIGSNVIMAMLNYDPLGRRPYYSASFEGANNTIWGKAPPELMEDCQRACNASARALVNNVALASGPQVEVHWDRLQPNENANKLWPWKIWKTKSDILGHNRNAINFFQPTLVAGDLIRVFEFFFGQAGEQLGIPAYESGVGNAATGAGKTAHGLSMLMSAAAKVLKNAISTVDTNVIKPIVQGTYSDLVLSEEMEYQGDINIIARASEFLIIAEQLQTRRQEFLMATNNPVDMAIIGYDGRAKILREAAKTLKMPEEVIPEPQEVMAKMQQTLQQQAGGAPQAPGQAGPPGGMGAGGPPPTGLPPPNQVPQAGQLPNDSIGSHPNLPQLEQLPQAPSQGMQP